MLKNINTAFPNYFLSSLVSFSCKELKNDGFVAKVTIYQRSLLNKLHVRGKIISCHKTPLKDGIWFS